MIAPALPRWSYLLVAYLALYALWTIEQWGGEIVRRNIGSLPMAIPGLAASLTVYLRSTREEDRLAQRGWRSLAGAIGIYTVCLLLWGFNTVIHNTAPFPTVADIFFLLFPWAVFGALVQLSGSHLSSNARARVITNTLIMVFALGLIEWVLLFRHLINMSGNFPTTVAAVLYPLGDLVMLGGVVFLLQHEWQAQRRTTLMLILSGVLLFMFGNFIYAVQVARGTYTSGTPLDLTWATGLTLFMFAALHTWSFKPEEQEPRTSRRRASSNLMVVLKFGAYAAVAALLVEPDTGWVDAIVVMVGLFGLGSAMHVRDRLNTIENLRLGHELTQVNAQLLQANDQLNERVQDAVSTLELRNSELALQSGRLEHRNKEIQDLTDVADLLQASLTLEEVRDVLLRAATTLFSQTRGSIAMINLARDEVETFVKWGEQSAADKDKVFSPSECWALRRGHAHHYWQQDDRVSMPCTHVMQGDPAAYLCVPLMAQGETIGVFRLLMDHQEPQAVKIVSERAQILARHVALAVANLRLRESLRHQSIRDPLTGLHNRRYLEEILGREISRALRAAIPLSLLILDIDHFKKVNDSFGHDGGDVVLKEIASVMQRHFREEDVVCRYGGEEFVVVLPNASPAQAAVRADQLRKTVEDLNLTFQRKPLGRVTVSVGLAGMSSHRSQPAHLIQAADQALYRAKNAGRNRVIDADWMTG